jgi:hypothetical protein
MKMKVYSANYTHGEEIVVLRRVRMLGGSTVQVEIRIDGEGVYKEYTKDFDALWELSTHIFKKVQSVL